VRKIDDHRSKRRKRGHVSYEATPATTETPGVKRLTLDLPKLLHKTIKRKAVERGVTMAQMLRALLLKHYSVRENTR
jgi:hypothetical protein